MIYGFAMLLFFLGLAVVVPALRKIRHMSSVRKHSKTTIGSVVSRKSAMNTAGWLTLSMVSASEVVNHERPLVIYQPPHEKEMSLDVIPSNFLSGRKYKLGEPVEVAYDLDEPWRAYLIREWKAAWRDFWLGSALSIFSIFLWIVGRVYDMPF